MPAGPLESWRTRTLTTYDGWHATHRGSGIAARSCACWLRPRASTFPPASSARPAPLSRLVSPHAPLAGQTVGLTSVSEADGCRKGGPYDPPFGMSALGLGVRCA